jgi:hypothetical protein
MAVVSKLAITVESNHIIVTRCMSVYKGKELVCKLNTSLQGERTCSHSVECSVYLSLIHVYFEV